LITFSIFNYRPNKTKSVAQNYKQTKSKKKTAHQQKQHNFFLIFFEGTLTSSAKLHSPLREKRNTKNSKKKKKT